jgi:hypothetical protein
MVSPDNRKSGRRLPNFFLKFKINIKFFKTFALEPLSGRSNLAGRYF